MVNRAGRNNIENLYLSEHKGIKKNDKNKQNKKVERTAKNDGICPQIFKLIYIQYKPAKKKPRPKLIECMYKCILFL